MSTAAVPEGRSSANEAAAELGGLFARHGRMVYGICRAMLRDVHEAEDATQQVFLSAHKALLGGARVRDAGGWLATIARNECRARIAAGMRRPLPVADEDLDAIPGTGDEHARREQRDEIRAALEQLPERQREAVVLRYLYGLRYGEVATVLGLSRPATEALLFRARRAMRTSLRPVAGAAIAVPLAVREQLALALPGFEERAAPMVAGAGVVGGVLAKLAAGSAGVKVATASVAVATVGAVGTVGPDRPTVPPAGAAIEQSAQEDGSTPAASLSASDDDSGSDDDRSGLGGGDEPERDDDDRSGPSGTEDDDRELRDDSSGPGAGDVENGRDPVDDRSGPSDELEATDTTDSSGPGSGGGGSSDSGPGSVDDERDEIEPGERSGSGSSGSSGDDEERTGEN